MKCIITIELGTYGVRVFAFDLDGVPPGASVDGAPLKLTVAGPGGAYEVTTKLQ